VLIAGVVLLGVLALPATNLRLGLPSNAVQPAESTLHQSYELLTGGFGEGFNATILYVVELGQVAEGDRTALVEEVAETISQDSNVAAVTPPTFNEAQTIGILSIVPLTGPDDDATVDLIERLRDGPAALVEQTGGVAYVTGITAVGIDVSAKLAEALPLFVAIIVILLTVAFRSLLVPLKAVLGFLLTIAVSLGVTVWAFQDGNLTGPLNVGAAAPIVSFVPVLLIGILFGLAMDYELFLVSRMREHYHHSGDAEEAVLGGLEQSGRVVSAAALIMAAVFGGFLLGDDPIIKSIALALAVGVLVDAFVVRMTLVPAAMLLLGRRAWSLPGWLDRLIPNVDIEGASLPTRGTAIPDRDGRE
jgi:RND superfamily putative drug exporter